MCKHPLPGDENIPGLRPSPLDSAMWRQVGTALRLCERHTLIVDLMLRDATDEQIADTLGVALCTTKTLLRRVRDRTQAPTRMQLAARVMTAVVEILQDGQRPAVG